MPRGVHHRKLGLFSVACPYCKVQITSVKVVPARAMGIWFVRCDSCHQVMKVTGHVAGGKWTDVTAEQIKERGGEGDG